MKDIFEDIATVGTNFEQQLRIKLDQDSRDINQNYNQTQPQSNISQMIPMNVSFGNAKFAFGLTMLCKYHWYVLKFEFIIIFTIINIVGKFFP